MDRVFDAYLSVSIVEPRMGPLKECCVRRG